MKTLLVVLFIVVYVVAVAQAQRRYDVSSSAVKLFPVNEIANSIDSSAWKIWGSFAGKIDWQNSFSKVEGDITQLNNCGNTDTLSTGLPGHLIMMWDDSLDQKQILPDSITAEFKLASRLNLDSVEIRMSVENDLGQFISFGERGGVLKDTTEWVKFVWHIYATDTSRHYLFYNYSVFSLVVTCLSTSYVPGTYIGARIEMMNLNLGVVSNIRKKDTFSSFTTLDQNYPNPFNPSTVITFSLPTSENVSLKVYDILGREVSTLVNKWMRAGNHTVSFNGSKLSSGMYVYRLTTGGMSLVKKMLLQK